MTPRTKEQNEEIRLQRLVQIRKAAAEVFLNKGPLLEIRDVAVQAGLGYGTVYHYYSNKGDLLHDLLWDALDRAGEWLKVPRASREVAAVGHSGLAGAAAEKGNLAGHSGLAVPAENGNPAAADSRSGCRETAAATELGPVAAAAVRLLQLWAVDPALYLLHKLAGEGFAALPEARRAPLSAAFRREILEPLAALPETGSVADGAAASGGNAAEPYQLQHAEMLLAALTGCASLSLRRGQLHEEAGDIIRFLKL